MQTVFNYAASNCNTRKKFMICQIYVQNLKLHWSLLHNPTLFQVCPICRGPICRNRSPICPICHSTKKCGPNLPPNRREIYQEPRDYIFLAILSPKRCSYGTNLKPFSKFPARMVLLKRISFQGNQQIKCSLELRNLLYCPC